ncbi:MAG: hypothetical protein VKL39_06680 [Leptolyngbyaceae bacterium]|nr:hypothetical protein [Leptolyngbyaceae bacterium]
MFDSQEQRAEIIRLFSLRGDSVGILHAGEAAQSAPDETLDEIICSGVRGVDQAEPLIPEILYDRLKIGGRVSTLLDGNVLSRTSTSDLASIPLLRFTGLTLLRSGNCGVRAIARFKKVEGGSASNWTRASYISEAWPASPDKFVDWWHAASEAREVLNLKTSEGVFAPSEEAFEWSKGTYYDDASGADLYVFQSAFKSIDKLGAKSAAEEGSACAFFVIQGVEGFSDTAHNAPKEAQVLRYECDTDITSVSFAKFLLADLLTRSGSKPSDLFNDGVANELHHRLVAIPRKFAQEAIIAFVESYDRFKPFASSQRKIRDQLTPSYGDHELLMRSACRLKQISIEHRWTALQQLSYDLPSPVAHCITAFFARDQAEHRGIVAGKLLDVAIELHALVAISVATDSFMPQAQNTAVAAISKARKITLGTWIDSILNPISRSYLRERDRLLAGGSDSNLSRLGQGGIYAMEGLFGTNTYEAVKEMQKVRNEESQAHAGLGREAQSEQFAEKVISAFINYFEATRVLWSTVSLNYCVTVAKNLSGSQAKFNQLSGSSYLLPEKQFDVPADFKFNPGQLALMLNGRISDSESFNPVAITPLYYAEKPEGEKFGPVFIYFINQIQTQQDNTALYVFNNYSYTDAPRKSLAENDPSMINLKKILDLGKTSQP